MISPAGGPLKLNLAKILTLLRIAAIPVVVVFLKFVKFNIIK